MTRDEKVQTGLRIPGEQYARLFDLAERMGVSLNALALVLIDIGLSAISLGTEAEYRLLLHSQQDSDG